MKRALVTSVLDAALRTGVGNASAVGITFFGEDNANASLPTPISDAAAAAFLGSLIG